MKKSPLIKYLLSFFITGTIWATHTALEKKEIYKFYYQYKFYYRGNFVKGPQNIDLKEAFRKKDLKGISKQYMVDTIVALGVESLINIGNFKEGELFIYEVSELYDKDEYFLPLNNYCNLYVAKKKIKRR